MTKIKKIISKSSAKLKELGSIMKASKAFKAKVKAAKTTEAKVKVFQSQRRKARKK